MNQEVNNQKVIIKTDRKSPVGFVHSWDVVTGADGPGTRLSVFLSGCQLRCVYCHNPDTWKVRTGKEMSVDDVMAELKKYKNFIKHSGGGLTITGGEPLVQASFTQNLLMAAKELGFHTALDTNGYLGSHVTDEFFNYVDLVLLDIKSFDSTIHQKAVGVDNKPILEFAKRLSDINVKTWVRFVMVPGWTDQPDNVAGVADFVSQLNNVERVDILPFHRMGFSKYEALGMENPLVGVEPPTQAEVEAVREIFRSRGINVI